MIISNAVIFNGIAVKGTVIPLKAKAFKDYKVSVRSRKNSRKKEDRLETDQPFFRHLPSAVALNAGSIRDEQSRGAYESCISHGAREKDFLKISRKIN